VERLRLRVGPRKRRKERGVDVDDPVGVVVDEGRGDNAQVACKDEELGLVGVDDPHRLPVVDLSVARHRFDGLRLQPVFARAFEGRGVSLVGEDEDDVRVELAGFNVVDDRLQVCPRAGDKDGEADFTRQELAPRIANALPT